MIGSRLLVSLLISLVSKASADFSTAIDCPLNLPVQTDTQYNYKIEAYYDEEILQPNFNASEIFVGNYGSTKSLSNDFTKKVTSARSRTMFWRKRVAGYPTLLLIFCTEDYFNENLNNEKTLAIPDRDNDDSKIQGVYYITEHGVKTSEDCYNNNPTDGKYFYQDEHSSLSDLLIYCGYHYDHCSCDMSTNMPPTEPRCGDIDQCHAEEDGYHCDGCASIYWTGDQCDKSVLAIGLFSITIISATSLIGAIVIPLQKLTFYRHIQGTLIAIAVGCLSGDAVFHLIPFLFGTHKHGTHEEHHDHDEHEHHDHDDHDDQDHDDHHDEHENHDEDIGINAGLMIMAGIYVFYLVELSIRRYHHHKERKSANSNDAKSNPEQEACLHEADDKASIGGHGHSHGAGTAGWMIILGDGLHNFADGLAIGAAFLQSYAIGLGTVFAVFFHELPHEMGDFAVLMKSGWTVKRALGLNFLSSLTCFIGFFAGIYLAGSDELLGRAIMGIAAGAFLYISLVVMLPEISREDVSSSWQVFTLHQVGLIFGALMMFLLATYEDVLIHFFT